MERSPRSVRAQVVGDHGDSEVLLWSSARIGGTAFCEWLGWTRDLEKPIASGVQTTAREIIKRKVATNHTIGLVTVSLVSPILLAKRRGLTMFTRQTDGEWAGVALSLPMILTGANAGRWVTR